MEVFLSFQMKSFEGTMVSEMTMVNDNTHSTSRLQPHLTPTQHTPVTSQHSQSQQQQRQTRHLPPTPSNHVRRQLSSPQVLCKVFVSGIGWGSQVGVHCSHLSACALCDVSETDMFSNVFQLSNGEVHVQFLDSSSLRIQASPMVVEFSDARGNPHK